MRRIVGLSIVVSTLVAGTASAAPQLTGPGAIRITSRGVSDTRVDLGGKGLTPGDVELIRVQLFNTRITSTSIGHGELVCTFVFGNSRSCTGTYFLPRGKIVVAGPIYYRQLYELAVIGGTGLYDNVRGSLTVTSIGSKPERDVLLFRLTV
jgi:hypothetical protein